MKHIQKIIENELKRMDTGERDVFRRTSLKTFEFLINDIDKRMTEFENKILDSAITKERGLSVINIIVPISETYLYEEDFAPVIPSDMSYPPLLEILKSEDKIYRKVILDADRDKLNDIENKIFKGKMTLNGKEYEFSLKLEKDKEYIEKIKEIYDVFGLNSLEWKTINVPYFNKIYKLKITNYSEELFDLLNTFEEEKIIIDKMEYKEYWLDDYVTLWNIQKISMLGNGEIEPTKDRIHYEHTLFFNRDENVYLCPTDEAYIYFIQKISDGFRIVTDENKDMKWEFLKILEVDEEIYRKKLKKPVFSNKIKMYFINKIKLENNVRLRNFAEIQRIVNSYASVSDRLELVRVEVSDEEREHVKTNDLNYFRLDEFKLKAHSSNMYMYFKVVKNDSYVKEILDFILSELQIYFPEYRYRGVLI